MAKASAETVVKTTVTLEMTGEEAEAVSVVLRKVAGDPRSSRRGYTANVLDALRAVGIDSSNYDLEGPGVRFESSEGIDTGRVL